METVTVTSLGAATQLVAPGDGPTLIMHQLASDPIVYLGESASTDPTDTSNTVPLAAPGFVVVDGERAVYAKCASGSATVNIISGGISFFQPTSQLVVVGSKTGILIYSPSIGAGNLIGAWTSTSGKDIYGNSFPGGFYITANTPIGGGPFGYVNIVSTGGVGGQILLQGPYNLANPTNPAIIEAYLAGPLGAARPAAHLYSPVDSTVGDVGRGIVAVVGRTATNQSSVVSLSADSVLAYGSPVVVRVGTSDRTAAVATSGAVETITDSVTFPAIAGNRYKIFVQLHLAGTVTTDQCALRAREDTTAGNQLYGWVDAQIISTGGAATSVRTIVVEWTAPVGFSGNKTIVATIQRFSGTGVYTAYASANDPTTIYSERVS